MFVSTFYLHGKVKVNAITRYGFNATKVKPHSWLCKPRYNASKVSQLHLSLVSYKTSWLAYKRNITASYYSRVA